MIRSPEADAAALAAVAAVPGPLKFMAWDRGYYEAPHRMFPHEHEVHGPFMAADEGELIAKLLATGIDPESVRWEPVE